MESYENRMIVTKLKILYVLSVNTLAGPGVTDA